MEIMLEGEDTMNTNTRMLIPEFEINQQIEKRIAYLEKVSRCKRKNCEVT